MAREATAGVRVSAAELTEWRGKARAAGVSLSELLHRAMGRTRAWTARSAAVERGTGAAVRGPQGERDRCTLSFSTGDRDRLRRRQHDG